MENSSELDKINPRKRLEEIKERLGKDSNNYLEAGDSHLLLSAYLRLKSEMDSVQEALNLGSRLRGGSNIVGVKFNFTPEDIYRLVVEREIAVDKFNVSAKTVRETLDQLENFRQKLTGVAIILGMDTSEMVHFNSIVTHAIRLKIQATQTGQTGESI